MALSRRLTTPRTFATSVLLLLAISSFVSALVFVPEAVASGTPIISNPTVNTFQTSLTLPAGGGVYLYGFATGGRLPSNHFSTGEIASVTDAAGILAADLAVTTSNDDSYSTSAEYYTIGGVSVSGFSSYQSFTGSNPNAGAPSASASFTVTQDNSLLVVIALSAGETAVSLSGVSGLTIDASSANTNGQIPVVVASATVNSGGYTVTETTSPNSDQSCCTDHMADLIGAFVFTPSTTSSESIFMFNACVNGLQVDINGGAAPGSAVTSITWDWGDQQPLTSWFPASHTYSSGGQYLVVATAHYGDGSSISSQPQSVGPGQGKLMNCDALTISAGQGGTISYQASVGIGTVAAGTSTTLQLDYADDLTLTAQPGSGYSFSSWAPSSGITGTGGSTVPRTSASILIVVGSSSAISASFAASSPTFTSVTCSPNQTSTKGTTTCTASVTGSSALTGSVTFSSSSSTGTFSPFHTANTNGECFVVSGSCHVTYADTTAGTPTVTALYGEDLSNGPSSGRTTLTVVPGDLVGIKNTITFTGLSVTKTSADNNQYAGCPAPYPFTISISHCFTIQQNSYISASPTRALWVQNVMIVAETTSNSFYGCAAFQIWTVGTDGYVDSSSPTYNDGCSGWGVHSYGLIGTGENFNLISTISTETVTMSTSFGSVSASKSWTCPTSICPSGTSLYFNSSPQILSSGVREWYLPQFVLVGPAGGASVTFGSDTAGRATSLVELTGGALASTVSQIAINSGSASTGESGFGLYWQTGALGESSFSSTLGSNPASECSSSTSYCEGVAFIPSSSALTTVSTTTSTTTNTPTATTTTTINSGAAAINQVSTTGIFVGVSGSAYPDGSIIIVTSQVLTGFQFSVPGIVDPSFFDVQVVGITDGTARVCVSHAGVVPGSVILYLLRSTWTYATNISSGATVCGDIPVPALAGTILAIGTEHRPQLTSTFLSCTGPAKVGSASTCTAIVLGTFVSNEGGNVSFYASVPGSFDKAVCVLSNFKHLSDISAYRDDQSCSVHFTPSSLVPFSPGTPPLTIMAFYAGDTDNRPSAGSSDIPLDPALTVITGNCDSTTILVNNLVICTATVVDASSWSTGTITWSQVGGSGAVSFSQSQCAIVSSQCQVGIVGTKLGSVTMKVAYSGDLTDLPSNTTFTFTVSSVAVTCVHVPHQWKSSVCTVKVAGTPTPTGRITWSGDGSGRFSSSNCRLSRTGTCNTRYISGASNLSVTITATYSGDKRNPASFGTFSLALSEH